MKRQESWKRIKGSLWPCANLEAQAGQIRVLGEGVVTHVTQSHNATIYGKLMALDGRQSLPSCSFIFFTVSADGFYFVLLGINGGKHEKEFEKEGEKRIHENSRRTLYSFRLIIEEQI
jgi:hypothetical protein